MADAKVWGSKKEKEKMEEEKEKRELRSPRDTEADAAVEVVGRADVAHRRAAEVGVAAPEAAAKQTVRTSRGSCGICHAC